MSPVHTPSPATPPKSREIAPAAAAYWRNIFKCNCGEERGGGVAGRKGLALAGRAWPSGARSTQPLADGQVMAAVIAEVSIPERARRVLVGVAWVVGTLSICIIGSKALTYLPVYLWNDRQCRWSDDADRWVDSALDFMSSIGTLIITAIIAALAVRSKLPGTGRRSGERRGFPVEMNSSNE